MAFRPYFGASPVPSGGETASVEGSFGLRLREVSHPIAKPAARPATTPPTPTAATGAAAPGAKAVSSIVVEIAPVTAVTRIVPSPLAVTVTESPVVADSVPGPTTVHSNVTSAITFVYSSWAIIHTVAVSPTPSEVVVTNASAVAMGPGPTTMDAVAVRPDDSTVTAPELALVPAVKTPADEIVPMFP